MKVEHTPGPWKVRASNEYPGCYFVLSSNAWPDEAESKANVRFIEAGPDMKKALEALMDYAAEAAVEPAVWQMAKAALAKAKGEGI